MLEVTMDVSSRSPTYPTGSNGPKPLTHDALVKALKYQGHQIKPALELLSQTGSEITVNNNLVTIMNGDKSIQLDLNKIKSLKSILSFNFKNKSSKNKDMTRITTLATKILEAVKATSKQEVHQEDQEVSASNVPSKQSNSDIILEIEKPTAKIEMPQEVSASNVPSKLSISEEETQELKINLNEVKNYINHLQAMTKPEITIKQVSENPKRWKNVITLPGIPEVYERCSELLTEILKASSKLGTDPKAVKDVITKSHEFLNSALTSDEFLQLQKLYKKNIT
jgi:hypothetical protein